MVFGGKFRGTDGSECAYSNGIYDPGRASYNYEPDSDTFRHVWLDVFPHFYYYIHGYENDHTHLYNGEH